jgi:CDP-diacylglycerol--glycerol-3-phosphate 3-phosphatidyltransferase
VVTLIGFVLTLGVAVVISQGYLRLAGILLIVAAGVDAVDGTLARMYGNATRFGAFLDSTMDRYSESVLFLGVAVYFIGTGATTEVMLTFAVLIGSFMVSYTRARAEGLGFALKGGLLTRFERAVVLIAALILNQLTIGLWLMAVLTNLTAFQRIWLVRLGLKDTQIEPAPAQPDLSLTGNPTES